MQTWNPFHRPHQELYKGGKDLFNTKMLTNPVGNLVSSAKLMSKNPGQALTQMSGIGRGLAPDVINGYAKAMIDPVNAQYKYDPNKSWSAVNGRMGTAMSTSTDGMSKTDYYRKQTFSPAEYQKWQDYKKASSAANGTLMQ